MLRVMELLRAKKRVAVLLNAGRAAGAQAMVLLWLWVGCLAE